MIDAAHLARELASHIPDDPTEESAVARTQELLERRADPFTRLEAEHVTGSAIVARPDGSAFLLVHHRRLAHWLQPGGHVDPEDQSVLATALREAREETGISSFDVALGGHLLDLDVHPIPATSDRPAHVHYDIRYLLTSEAEPLAVAPQEIHAARWFSLGEALAAGVDVSLSRALSKASVRLRPR